MILSENCVRADRPNQPKMKKWDNFDNYRPIKLKFGMLDPFTYPHATVTFCNDPTVFFYRPTRPTKKFPIAKFLNGPNMSISDGNLMRLGS